VAAGEGQSELEQLRLQVLQMDAQVTYREHMAAGTLDQLMVPLFQNITGDISTEQSWGIMAEFFLYSC
jgi:hypothetical protein